MLLSGCQRLPSSAPNGIQLRLDPPHTTANGDHTFQIRVTDDNGDTVTMTYTVTITGSQPLATNSVHLMIGAPNQLDTADIQRWLFTASDGHYLPADLVEIAQGNTVYLERFEFDIPSNSVLQLRTSGHSNDEIITSWEIQPQALRIVSGSLVLDLPGPQYVLNSFEDSAEPYHWTPDAAGEQEIADFVSAFRALSDLDRASTTLTFYW